LTNQFPGKTLREKIQLILNNRLKDLKDEMERDNTEKKRIEMNAPTNIPSTF
jgi:hypothetical protein